MVFSNFSCTKSSNQILFKNTTPIQNIGVIKLYSDDSTGTFTAKEFRWSYNNNYWSSWESLNQGNITRINTSNYQNLYLEIRYLFTSADSNVNSFLINYVKSSQSISTQSYDDEVITLQKPLTNAELLESKKGSYYLDRANHKGEQPISSIINLNKTLTNYANYINNNTSWQQSIDASINNLDSSIDDIYNILKPIINIDSSTINIDASGNIQLLFNQYHYYKQTIGENTIGDVRFYVDSSSYFIDMLTSLSPETWTPKWIVKSVNNVLPDVSGNIDVSVYDDTEIRVLIDNKVDKVTSKLTFDGSTVALNFPENVYEIYKLSSAISITCTNLQITKGAVLLLQGDGSSAHIPTFTNATQEGDEVFDYTNNYVNPIILWYRGDKLIYSIMTSYNYDNIEMTLSSQSIENITQITADWIFTPDKTGSVYYLIKLSNAEIPDKTEILSNGETITLLSTSEHTENITGLSYSNDYIIYYYTVNESDVESDIEQSEEFSTIARTQMTSPVISITADGQTALDISVNINVNGVELYMSETSEGIYNFYEDLSTGYTMATKLTGLESGTTRYFKGIALGNYTTTIDSSLSIEYSGTTNSSSQLSSPTMGSVTADSSSAITVNVSNVDQNSTYLKLEYKQSSSETWIIDSSTLSKNTTSKQVTGLSASTEYNFRWTSIGDGINYTNSNPSSVGTQSTFSYYENVIFTNKVNVTQTGTSLKKTSGSNSAWDGGGYSTKAVVNGYVECRYVYGRFAIGLSDGDTNQNYTSIDICFLAGTINYMVYKNGALAASNLGTKKVGDIIRMNYNAGSVTIYINGNLVYTDTVSLTDSKGYIDTSFYSVKDEIDSVIIGGTYE